MAAQNLKPGPVYPPAPSDTVPAMLTPGEVVLNKGAVAIAGLPNLNKLNEMGLRQSQLGRPGYAEGGQAKKPVELTWLEKMGIGNKNVIDTKKRSIELQQGAELKSEPEVYRPSPQDQAPPLTPPPAEPRKGLGLYLDRTKQIDSQIDKAAGYAEGGQARKPVELTWLEKMGIGNKNVIETKKRSMELQQGAELKDEPTPAPAAPAPAQPAAPEPAYEPRKGLGIYLDRKQQIDDQINKAAGGANGMYVTPAMQPIATTWTSPVQPSNSQIPPPDVTAGGFMPTKAFGLTYGGGVPGYPYGSGPYGVDEDPRITQAVTGGVPPYRAGNAPAPTFTGGETKGASNDLVGRAMDTNVPKAIDNIVMPGGSPLSAQPIQPLWDAEKSARNAAIAARTTEPEMMRGGRISDDFLNWHGIEDNAAYRISMGDTSYTGMRGNPLDEHKQPINLERSGMGGGSVPSAATPGNMSNPMTALNERMKHKWDASEPEPPTTPYYNRITSVRSKHKNPMNMVSGLTNLGMGVTSGMAHGGVVPVGLRGVVNENDPDYTSVNSGKLPDYVNKSVDERGRASYSYKPQMPPAEETERSPRPNSNNRSGTSPVYGYANGGPTFDEWWAKHRMNPANPINSPDQPGLAVSSGRGLVPTAQAPSSTSSQDFYLKDVAPRPRVESAGDLVPAGPKYTMDRFRPAPGRDIVPAGVSNRWGSDAFVEQAGRSIPPTTDLVPAGPKYITDTYRPAPGTDIATTGEPRITNAAENRFDWAQNRGRSIVPGGAASNYVPGESTAIPLTTEISTVPGQSSRSTSYTRFPHTPGTDLVPAGPRMGPGPHVEDIQPWNRLAGPLTTALGLKQYIDENRARHGGDFVYEGIGSGPTMDVLNATLNRNLVAATGDPNAATKLQEANTAFGDWQDQSLANYQARNAQYKQRLASGDYLGESQSAATQPAATQPAATQPAATQPAATQPATTQAQETVHPNTVSTTPIQAATMEYSGDRPTGVSFGNGQYIRSAAGMSPQIADDINRGLIRTTRSPDDAQKEYDAAMATEHYTGKPQRMSLEARAYGRQFGLDLEKAQHPGAVRSASDQIKLAALNDPKYRNAVFNSEFGLTPKQDTIDTSIDKFQTLRGGPDQKILNSAELIGKAAALAYRDADQADLPGWDIWDAQAKKLALKKDNLAKFWPMIGRDPKELSGVDIVDITEDGRILVRKPDGSITQLAAD